MRKELDKDLILRYGIICGKRRSKKQKVNFLKVAKKQFEQSGFITDVTKSSIKFMKSESASFYNLYAGNMKDASMLFITYYDTPVKSILPQKQYAFETGFSKLNVYVNLSLTLCIIALAIGILYFVIVPGLNNDGFMSVWGIAALCICSIFFFIVKHVRDGVANRYNMVRNTSSIISLLLLADELNEEEKKNVAFAFIDGGTSNCYGQKMLEEYLGKKHKTRIYLDSIGNKGDIQCFTNHDFSNVSKITNIHKLGEKQKEFGDILITAGSIQNHKVYIPGANTRKDKNLEVSTITNVVEALLDIARMQILMVLL